MGDFWDSTGNVNEENTLKKKNINGLVLDEGKILNPGVLAERKKTGNLRK